MVAEEILDQRKEVVKADTINWKLEKGRFRKVEYLKYDRLPSDIYEVKEDDNGILFKKIEFPSDNLMLLPGMPNEYILDQMNSFWDRGDIFRECGLLHKRGILLYGPAGCGKTSIIRMLSTGIINRDGIVLNTSNVYRIADGLAEFRSVETDRPILLIIEDIDGEMEDSDNAQVLLSLLDGQKQVNKIVYLATTNNPEKLEDRIVKRPGRFDLVIGLNPPIKDARIQYMKSLVKDRLSDTELEELGNLTHGMGIAHLRELIAAWICLGMDRDETLQRLRTNIKHTPKIKGKEMGFIVSYDGQTGVKEKE